MPDASVWHIDHFPITEISYQVLNNWGSEKRTNLDMTFVIWLIISRPHLRQNKKMPYPYNDTDRAFK